MQAYKPDEYVFLGDLCGYYPYAYECFQLLESLSPTICLKGNHDDYFLRIFNGDELFAEGYSKKYGAMYSYLALNQKHLSSVIEWINSKKSVQSLDSIGGYFIHGTIEDTLEGRLYPSEEHKIAGLQNAKNDAKLIAMGHTHYTLESIYQDSRLINPGSIGQPRQGLPPSFYIYDTKKQDGQHVYFSYPRDQFVEALNKDCQVSKYSSEVIWRY